MPDCFLGQRLPDAENLSIRPIEIYFEQKEHANRDLPYFRIDRSKILTHWFLTDAKGDRIGLSLS